MSAPDMKTRHPHKVLLAEDNPINQRVAAAILQSVNLEVIIASDGEEALDLLDEQVTIPMAEDVDSLSVNAAAAVVLYAAAPSPRGA